MAAIGLSATRIVDWAESYEVAAANTIAEGCIVINTNDDGVVSLPGGADAAKVAGVCMDAGSATAGQRINVQKAGKAIVILAASQTVVPGDLLMAADSSGRCKKVTTETSGTVVGRAEQAVTSGVGEFPWIECTLMLQEILA